MWASKGAVGATYLLAVRIKSAQKFTARLTQLLLFFIHSWAVLA
jgi:hypothetical protein